MEKVDKDVAAMIANLKKYDKLVESFVPMAPMGRLAEKKEELDELPEEVDPDLLKEKSKKPWDKEEKKVDEAKADPTGSWVAYNKDKSKKFATHGGAKGYADKMGAGWKTAGSEHYHDTIAKKADTKVDEGVDPDVIAWMARFSKLGNMKGYGR